MPRESMIVRPAIIVPMALRCLVNSHVLQAPTATILCADRLMNASHLLRDTSPRVPEMLFPALYAMLDTIALEEHLQARPFAMVNTASKEGRAEQARSVLEALCFRFHAELVTTAETAVVW